MSKEVYFGLSDGNKKLIVSLTFITLLLWGPIEPYGMVVRILYLVLIPVLIWFALGILGNKFAMDEAANDRLFSSIMGGIAALLLVWSYSAYTSDFHKVCTERKLTHDGNECVGEYASAEGGDKGTAFMLLMFAGLVSWLSVISKSD